jgi:hypothetical protein
MPEDALPAESWPTDTSAWAPPAPREYSTPPDMSSWAPPVAPGALDPSAATGPPWPRLVASPGSGYRAPRLIRWPIVVGAICFAIFVARDAIRFSSTSSTVNSAPPYVLAAKDAGFTATFPGKPQRIQKTVDSVPAVLYISSLSNEAVGVAYFPLGSRYAFSLDGAIDGVAASEADGKVVSHTSISYQGQPAEDAVISFSGGVGDVRAVVIGSNAYLFEGLGTSASSFVKDYSALLDTFTLTSPPRASTTSPPATAPVPSPTTLPTTGAGVLGSKIVPAPAGFAIFQQSGVQNGPLTASGFDSFVASPGAAAQLHYVTGYQTNYGDISNGDVLNVSLLEFASAQDAANFVSGFSVDGVKTGADPAIAGAQIYDSTSATDGSYEHGVIAAKNNVVMTVDYASGSATRPTLVDTLAAEQYARLG